MLLVQVESTSKYVGMEQTITVSSDDTIGMLYLIDSLQQFIGRAWRSFVKVCWCHRLISAIATPRYSAKTCYVLFAIFGSGDARDMRHSVHVM
jgi:hypothetical protein